MFKHALVLTASLMASSTTYAQHVHGQGELLISKEGSEWLLHLTIPKADAIGFEHAPQTDAEKKRLNQLISRIENNNNVVSLDGKCSLIEISHGMQKSVMADKHSGHKHHAEHEHDKHAHDDHDDHKAHKHDEHAHDHDHEHHDHDHHKTTHSDAEADFHFNCENDVKEIKLEVFSWMPSLEKVSAQWITDVGQGQTTLTSANNVIKF